MRETTPPDILAPMPVESRANTSAVMPAALSVRMVPLPPDALTPTHVLSAGSTGSDGHLAGDRVNGRASALLGPDVHSCAMICREWVGFGAFRYQRRAWRNVLQLKVEATQVTQVYVHGAQDLPEP
jgi:hypothetical protein